MPVPVLKKQQTGFTLIELVTVIVLLGILTVAIAPRFTGKKTFVEFAVRDQIISAYRYAQQWAMNDHSGNCYSLRIDATGFGPQRDNGTTTDYFGPVGQVAFAGEYEQVSATAHTIYFDGLGNALSGSCTGTLLNGVLTITLSYAGSPSVALEIYPSGYVRRI